MWIKKAPLLDSNIIVGKDWRSSFTPYHRSHGAGMTAVSRVSMTHPQVWADGPASSSISTVIVTASSLSFFPLLLLWQLREIYRINKSKGKICPNSCSWIFSEGFFLNPRFMRKYNLVQPIPLGHIGLLALPYSLRLRLSTPSGTVVQPVWNPVLLTSACFHSRVRLSLV